VLEKTSKKLQEAGNHIDAAAVRSRSIEKKLKGVQEMPGAEAAALLELEPWDEDTETL
jgi:DNA recombination protein RmuC